MFDSYSYYVISIKLFYYILSCFAVLIIGLAIQSLQTYYSIYQKSLSCIDLVYISDKNILYNVNLDRMKYLYYILLKHFILSFLDTVPKYHESLRKFYCLSYLFGFFVNNYMDLEIVIPSYLFLQSIFNIIIIVEQYILFSRKNIKDIFCSIFVIS